MRDISLLSAIAAVLLGSIGFAVPDNSPRARRYRAMLWGLAAAFLVFNIMLWRATSLDIVQYGSCLLDSKPDVCAPVRGTHPAPVPSPSAKASPPAETAGPFPIAQSWAGTARTDTSPPQALPKELPIRLYRTDQSNELLLRFGECVQRLQLTASDGLSRTYAANTDLTLSGGWGKYPWPCCYSDWLEKLTHNDDILKLSYVSADPDTLIFEWREPDQTDGTHADTVYRGTMTRD